jgi:hypothetical protein
LTTSNIFVHCLGMNENLIPKIVPSSTGSGWRIVWVRAS